jgi:cyclophilin family peptidyl-prolyl cis-trans isomerase
VGTAKRERQKANRQLRLEQLQRQQAKSKRNRTVLRWSLAALVILVVGFGIWLFNRGKNNNTVAAETPTTAPGPTTTVGLYGTTPCPKADGSSPKTRKFTSPPKLCVDAKKTYTASVQTNKGSFTIALDPKKAPATVNNFVVLARYHFYDGVPCHRIVKDYVVQCGDPTGSGDGGPGYVIADELPTSGTYKVGDVAMANSGPDTNGSQFFVVSGRRASSLGLQYSLFGHVAPGADATIKALNAAAGPDPDAAKGDAGGTPTKVPVNIVKVAISEK